MRCAGKTKLGKMCKNEARINSRTCHIHGKRNISFNFHNGIYTKVDCAFSSLVREELIWYESDITGDEIVDNISKNLNISRSRLLKKFRWFVPLLDTHGRDLVPDLPECEVETENNMNSISYSMNGEWVGNIVKKSFNRG